ncbi:copper chaperone PCu(A)C [Pelomonas sp. SE-A7]|uniref:copper chaperone PCu(A)C n=1 Tax=Pelomonas sp. SE-A7 TaxID=3054953 RepID=UPI00259CCF05|nr:copper chaperone PCu(A)C [Pelomonas sp. SE-A7]MDM4764672.1 copper chaperone PCu(A)C [Pelomonas sp. SE-A7]
MRNALIALLAGLASIASHAQQLQVSDAWARATVAQQKASGAFFQLRAQADVRLVEARSPAAMMVEIHEMAMEGSVMRMRAVEGLDLKAGKTVEFKPGGLHVMLMGLSKPLNAGDRLPLTLVYEDKAKKRHELQVQAEVRAPHPKAQ